MPFIDYMLEVTDVVPKLFPNWKQNGHIKIQWYPTVPHGTPGSPRYNKLPQSTPSYLNVSQSTIRNPRAPQRQIRHSEGSPTTKTGLMIIPATKSACEHWESAMLAEAEPQVAPQEAPFVDAREPPG